MKEDERASMAHAKQGYRSENDWPAEDLDYIARHYKAGTTISVHVSIEGEPHVLNIANVKRILSTGRLMSVMDCGCRTMYGHCDAPLNVIKSGCGLCVSTCPTNATRRVNKP